MCTLCKSSHSQSHFNMDPYIGLPVHDTVGGGTGIFAAHTLLALPVQHK